MISNYYNSEEKDKFLNYESKLVFSKNYRGLNKKTQLFSSLKGDHFRNRMVHTEEVRVIALRIINYINKELNTELINLNLVSCIAISHDFGHTPFGHIGERTLQNILKQSPFVSDKIFFKHNINSMRLLIDEFGDDIPWQILDGALKHSRLSYIENSSFNVSYMLAKNKYDKIYYLHNKEGGYLPLTLEGQIVAISDEIAQRYGNYEDTFRAKNINSLKKILDEIKIYTEENCKKYINKLLDTLVNSVVIQSCINIKSLTFETNEEQLKWLSKHSVINFDENGLKLNKKIDNFVKECIDNIDELRRDDERNSYIIKKLFKAYYNNCQQMSGQFYHNFIYNIYTFIKKNTN